ncbi:MAG: transposase [Cyanobacteriota bacterium]|nr:transposase [Cyanobacteriota bacterium]
MVRSRKKKQKQIDYTYTQIMSVTSVSDPSELNKIANLQGQCRAATYNKLGSLQGWGQHWKGADKVVRELCPSQDQLPGKLREWAVNDCFKAISAQQEAAKVFISRDIWRRYPLTNNEKQRKSWYENKLSNLGKKCKKEDKEQLWEQALIEFPASEVETRRKSLLYSLISNPTKDSELHRIFRKQYVPGHTFVRNQVVYQGQGYKASRLKRNLIKIDVQGLSRGQKITLVVRSQRIPTKQIRVIRGGQGKYEIHTTFTDKIVVSQEKPNKTIGLDKGYTEGFYSSENVVIASELGKTLTQKTNRSNQRNKNRNRLFQHAENHSDKNKSARIKACNLGSKKKNKKLQQDKATIRCMIRKDLYAYITQPTLIVAEDLSRPIPGKKMAKSLNRKLNQWMKGELQDSLIAIGRKTGSTVATVNCAYTSQVDSQTGTLLGSRKGDRFIRFTGDVLQSDYNASINIKLRYEDPRISNYMTSDAVREVLLGDTVRYLLSIGETVSCAIRNNWLAKKFHKEALSLEANITQRGSGYVETSKAGSSYTKNNNNQCLPVTRNQQQSSHECLDTSSESSVA